MRNLLAILALLLSTSPAFAEPVPVSAPETLSLLGIGLVAALLARKKKKR